MIYTLLLQTVSETCPNFLRSTRLTEATTTTWSVRCHTSKWTEMQLEFVSFLYLLLCFVDPCFMLMHSATWAAHYWSFQKFNDNCIAECSKLNRMMFRLNHLIQLTRRSWSEWSNNVRSVLSFWFKYIN